MAPQVDQVLGLVLPRVPFQEDAGENRTVVELLQTLVSVQHAALSSHLPECRRALRDALSQEKIDDADAVAAATAMLQQMGG